MGIRVRPKKSLKKQLNLQVQLNTIHENIRDSYQESNYFGFFNQNRKLLLVFHFVEIMELAIATSSTTISYIKI
jgi:hypothetical protein